MEKILASHRVIAIQHDRSIRGFIAPKYAAALMVVGSACTPPDARRRQYRSRDFSTLGSGVLMGIGTHRPRTRTTTQHSTYVRSTHIGFGHPSYACAHAGRSALFAWPRERPVFFPHSRRTGGRMIHESLLFWVRNQHERAIVYGARSPRRTRAAPEPNRMRII
jgi:hypothetical protein